MKELLYTILELEEWCSNNARCDFCSNIASKNNKAVCQIRTRDKLTGEMVENDKACENCKEKFENDELPRCSCGRLKTRYSCDCKEEGQEKKLPLLPHQTGGMALFYETQINSLQEQLIEAEEALQIEREEVAKFQEKSEEWSKRQKRELISKINDLEKKIKYLEEENERLKEQNTQVEVSSKNGSIKHFFKFGLK